MEIQKINCTSCGAPLQVSAEMEKIVCPYCTTGYLIQQSDGMLALKLAEKMSQTVQQANAQTQSTILKSTQTTQTELRRLQISQELAGLQIQLSNTRAEIRSLERGKKNRTIKRQLKDLRQQESRLIYRVKELESVQAQLNRSTSTSSASSRDTHLTAQTKPLAPRSWGVTLFLCLFLGFFGVHRFYTGHKNIGFIQLVTLGGFGIWWMIDLLLILANAYRDAQGRSLEGNPQFRRGCVGGLVTYFVLFTCIVMAGGLASGAQVGGNPDATPTTSEAESLLAFGLTIIAAIAGLVVFAYIYNPQAPIWRQIKTIFRRGNQPGSKKISLTGDREPPWLDSSTKSEPE